MKHSRNRITPFLVIVLLVLVWILISVIVYKLIAKRLSNIKKLKLDDELVEELYSYVSDDDIFVFSDHDYTVDSLPDNYIIRKATSFMTIEDVAFSNNQIAISYESLDSAIKTAFGPDIKYDLTDFNGTVDTYLELDDYKLQFTMYYDKTTNSFVGTYQKVEHENDINVKRKLVQATKTDTVNLKIGYLFYKQGVNYQICSNSTCDKIIKEVSSLDDIEYDNYLVISLNKSSDEVYYYYKNS